MLSFISLLTSVIITFSKVRVMSFFHTKISDCNKYLSHNIFPVCLIESHLSSLTNVKNPTSNFRLFVQIDNCKAFCVTPKRKHFDTNNLKQMKSHTKTFLFTASSY